MHQGIIRLSALFLFFFISFVASSQNKTIAGSFEFKKLSDENQREFYSKAIMGADMESYRSRDKRVTLKFDNGFELELFSAKEMVVKGIQVNPNSYEETHDKKIEYPVFVINSKGFLLAQVRTIDPKIEASKNN
jgi:hypothetical protein